MLNHTFYHSATTGQGRGSGRGTNGGVWEWTSTVLDKTEGFVSSTLYPGYTSDFFDGKHQVVVSRSQCIAMPCNDS